MWERDPRNSSPTLTLSTAVTLHANGKTDINTAVQAAEAPRPIAGIFASLLFSLGVIGTGLLALPLLGESSVYAVGEALRWPVGLERKAKEAKAFYAVFHFQLWSAWLSTSQKLDPIKALIGAPINQRVTAAPVMCLIKLLASRRKVMGELTLPVYFTILG